MQMNGLGFWAELATVAYQAYASKKSGGGGGGSAAGGGLPSINVSPAIQTQVSPMISPVFQQQFQPQNSALTAGTQQIAPTVQSAPQGLPANAMQLPGTADQPYMPTNGGDFPAGLPAIPGGAVPQKTAMQKYGVYIVLGLLGVAGYVIYKRRANRTLSRHRASIVNKAE